MLKFKPFKPLKIPLKMIPIGGLWFPEPYKPPLKSLNYGSFDSGIK